MSRTTDLPPTSYALLGLLTLGDAALTGYELKQRADRTMRFYWTSPAMSQVYSELARLTELGLVRTLGEGRGTSYKINAKGRRVLQRWLHDTPPDFPVLKHPVALRMMIGHLSTPEELKRLLTGYLEELAASRADLADVRRSLEGADAPGQAFRHPSLVAEWGLAYFDSERAIAERILDELDREPPR